MHRRAGKWLTVTFIIALWCAVLYPYVTPSIPIHNLWYRISGSPGSAKALAYMSKQRRQNALHPGCGNGRQIPGQAMASLCSLAEGNSHVLNNLLSDHDPKIRGTVALAIGRVSNGWYRPTLEKLVLTDSDRPVRAYACYALKEIGDKRSEPVYRSVLAKEKGKFNELRALALWSLVRLHDEPKLRNELRQMAKADPYKEVKRMIEQDPTLEESYTLYEETRHGPQHAWLAMRELGEQIKR